MPKTTEITYRYWVCQKETPYEWSCVAKTNSRWKAFRIAKRLARKGHGIKVVDHG